MTTLEERARQWSLLSSPDELSRSVGFARAELLKAAEIADRFGKYADPAARAIAAEIRRLAAF